MRPRDPRTRGLFPALGVFIAFMLVLAVRGVLGRAGVYAYVNDQPIQKPMVDFEKELILRGEGKTNPNSGQERAALAAAVDIAVDRCLASQEARRRGLVAKEELVKGYRRQVADRMEALGHPEEVMRALRLTERDIAAEIERDVLRSLLVEQIDAAISEPTEEEQSRFYNEHIEQFREDEAAHILVMSARKPADPVGQEAARLKLEVARQEVAAGADFRGVASRFREGLAVSRGGDLGFVKKGYLPPPMESAIAGLADGAVTDIVETRDGYHVMQVIGRRHFGYTPLAEARGGIRQRMRVQERERQVSKLLNRLRASSRIVRYN